MATRIENILLRARDTLADPRKERWSDERLIRLIDEGQKDIAKQTKLLKAQTELSMAVGQAVYALPEDLWLITRATFNDTEIGLTTYDVMDQQARTDSLRSKGYDGRARSRNYGSSDEYTRYMWELDTAAEVTNLIYDRRDQHEIRVYPIPNAAIAASQYTFATLNPDPDFVGEELLGVVTAIDDYTMNSVFGVVTDLYDPFVPIENFAQVLGVTTQVNESDAVVRLWYVKMPADVTSIDDDLEVSSMWDIALKFYVVGKALHDDLDERYRAMSADEFAMYNRELQVAQVTSNKDGVRSPNTNRTNYRSAFE
jgi:hypothetical protein